MIELNVNGRSVEIDDDPATPLLYVLRGTLGLNGAKFGCGLGQCGACTVIAGSEAIFSCITPISALAGRRITTLEGLGTRTRPGTVQRAFIEEQAAQCGYCIPGMMMRAQALLERNPAPTDAEIRAALAPHLCRCGSHMRVLRAVRRASRAARAGSAGRSVQP
ncbi:MAG TPA: (2Fe-2S)-binding protein [Steroidobacteraceae bacterium]|nr:(2Fe-2S)-binding protein [Steroidobacteraceae bacterium]